MFTHAYFKAGKFKKHWIFLVSQKDFTTIN